MSWPLSKAPRNIPRSYHTWDVHTSKLGHKELTEFAQSLPRDRTCEEPLTVKLHMPSEGSDKWKHKAWLQGQMDAAGGCPCVSIVVY